MIDPYLSERSISEARDHLADVIDEAVAGGTVFLTRRGRRVVAVVNAEDWEAVVTRLEDESDRAAIAEAIAEDDWVSLEDLKAELGF